MKINKSLKIWENYKDIILPTNEFIEPILKKGSGSFVWDVDENKYLDLNCGQFCLCFGHNYLPLIKIITKQSKTILHTNTSTLTSIVLEALKKLIEITDQTFHAGIFLSTGAEAVEFALRFSKSISKNNKIIFLNQGYHGLSLGAQSVSSYGKWAFPKVTETFGVTVPKTTNEINLCIKNIEKILDENRGEIAAIIMEPILGAGGMIFPPIRFFEEIRRLCNTNKIILIFDECQTGFGRTGNWFCYQEYMIKPDILIFAKASGAGIPVSGLLFKEDLVNKMREGNLTHFSSHQNDPLAAAVLLFVIKEIEKQRILKRVRRLGKIFLKKITEISQRNTALIRPRGLGLMIAFDLNEKLFSDGKNAGQKLVKNLLSQGVIIQSIEKGRTIRLMPSFFISIYEINFFTRRLKIALKNIENE